MVTKSDLRAKLSPKGKIFDYRVNNIYVENGYAVPFLGPGEALRRTNGIIFPFTPNINVAHQVDYSQYDLVHTNYQQNSLVTRMKPWQDSLAFVRPDCHNTLSNAVIIAASVLLMNKI